MGTESHKSCNIPAELKVHRTNFEQSLKIINNIGVYDLYWLIFMVFLLVYIYSVVIYFLWNWYFVNLLLVCHWAIFVFLFSFSKKKKKIRRKPTDCTRDVMKMRIQNDDIFNLCKVSICVLIGSENTILNCFSCTLQMVCREYGIMTQTWIWVSLLKSEIW